MLVLLALASVYAGQTEVGRSSLTQSCPAGHSSCLTRGRKEAHMRRKRFFAALALAGLSVIFAPRPAHGQVSISISFFHDELAPQGRWIVAADYGDAWIPSGVPGGWTPYVDGEWVYSDYGWTWVSEDPWG